MGVLLTFNYLVVSRRYYASSITRMLILNTCPPWEQISHVHGDSIIGRKVTDAVICRITLWISFFTSASSFCFAEELLTAHNTQNYITD